MSSYATDGKCHNAQPGTFGHECGKPAVWVGTKAGGFSSGFCADCKEHGHEARVMARWETVEQYRARSLTMTAFDGLQQAGRADIHDKFVSVRTAARKSL